MLHHMRKYSTLQIEVGNGRVQTEGPGGRFDSFILPLLLTDCTASENHLTSPCLRLLLCKMDLQIL